MRKYKTRIMILVAIIMAVMYFTGDFSFIDIQKTAIIVALGIDKKDEGFEVTAQIAIPQATDQSAENNDALVSADGDTIFQAIDNIGIKTGWQPKLSFCDLILLGEEILSESIVPIVEYVLASQKLQNSALIAGCKGTAKETLNHATALDAISSFAIQKILLKNTLKVNTVNKSNVREFSILHYSKSNSGFMPMISSKTDDSKGKEGTSSSQMASTAGGSSDSPEKSGESKNVIFDATKTAVFSNGKMVATLDKEETLVFSLLKKKVDESYVSVDIDGENVLLSITKNSKRLKVEFEEKPTLNIYLKLVVNIADSTKKTGLDNVSKTTVVSDKLLSACEKKVTGIINSMTEKLKSANADILQAKNLVYKYDYNSFRKIEDLPISNYEYKAIVKAVSLD